MNAYKHLFPDDKIRRPPATMWATNRAPARWTGGALGFLTRIGAGRISPS